MREIRVDINRSINNISFFVSVIMVVLVIALGAGTKQLFPYKASQGLPPYYHANILFSSLSSEIVLMSVPILSAFPYTVAFLDEYNSGYIKMYLLKCEKRGYIKGKVIAPAVSGGLCLVFGILTTYLIGALIYMPMEIADQNIISPFLDILKKCMLFFVCGSLWASVGALFANISLSKYMAYASPFVFFYVLVILCERYFRKIYVINPEEWLTVQNYWPLSEWGVILLVLLITIILCMINDFVIEGRIDSV